MAPLHTEEQLAPARNGLVAEDDELSDEQIQSLLKQAEARLRERPTSAAQGVATFFKFPRLNVGDIAQPYVRTDGDVARVESSKLLDKRERNLSNQIRKVEDPVVVKQKLLEEKKATAGSSWYNLPRTDLTPELKRDLQLLKMRNTLNPHRHYKKDNGKARAPEFSQVGTIIEGNTEFYSGRLLNKDRKQTFVEEVLAGEAETGRFKRKYSEIQAMKSSGKKAYYKALKAKRSKSGHKG